MVEEVTAVPHGQQCLEEIQSIRLSWLQTSSWRQQEEGGSETPEILGTTAQVQRPRAALPSQACSSSTAGLGYWLPNGSFSPHSEGHILTCSSPKRPPRRAQGSASLPSRIGAMILWHPGSSRTHTHEVSKNLLGRGDQPLPGRSLLSQLQGCVPQLCSLRQWERALHGCFPEEGAQGTWLPLTLNLETCSGHHLVIVLGF